ncbi:HIG1 domain-containing protein [Neomegalonema sp.]|uniref:HIG1 domain-containing protein n=1 Tax=Neomegalonema sp. TaxID=2039713 RepID=UPI0026315ABC|nr:HIG1 domain-containing protein [Neomegalonema sp.]MDD2867140.1 HIG1 domain-containing protein [Neomegalonema sp.]
MQAVMIVVAPALALATLFVLIKGILGVGTGRGDVERARASNRLMRWRVGLQFGAVIAFLILYALLKGGS